MKITGVQPNKRRAIAMTEYLIILAIVAIAAIAIVGLFGAQIKDVFYRNTAALGGSDTTGANNTAITGGSKSADTGDSMASFDNGKNGAAAAAK